MIQLITLIGFLLWLLVYWEGGRKAWADIRHAASRLDAALMLVIAAGAIAIAAGGLVVVLDPTTPTPPLPAALGLLLTATGIGGTFYTRHYLGRFWTAETALQEEHRVVDTGPYALVRHPIYAAVILMYLGLGLAFSRWWLWIAVAVVIVAYIWKARLEDRFLATALPGYKEYRRRVRYMLVPGIW